MKIKIIDNQEEQEIDAVFSKKAMPFGKNGCHVTLPKKYVGYTVLILIKTKTGQWVKGYLEKFRKRGDKKELV